MTDTRKAAEAMLEPWKNRIVSWSDLATDITDLINQERERCIRVVHDCDEEGDWTADLVEARIRQGVVE